MSTLIISLIVFGALLAIAAGIAIHQRRQREARERRARAIEYLRKQRDRDMEAEMRRKVAAQRSTTAVPPRSTASTGGVRNFSGTNVSRSQPAVADDGTDLLTNVLIYDALFNQRPAAGAPLIADQIYDPVPFSSSQGGSSAGGGASSTWDEPAPQAAPEPEYTCKASDYSDNSSSYSSSYDSSSSSSSYDSSSSSSSYDSGSSSSSFD